MKKEIIRIKIHSVIHRMEIIRFENKDKKALRLSFQGWLQLNKRLRSIGSTRNVNIPEGLTEALFCLDMGSVRVIKTYGGKGSFDTINLAKKLRQQIKASSSKGPTSFGPRSFWDPNELYWMDFFKNGGIDGDYDIYKIPDKYIYTASVKKNTRLSDQQKQFRRPRIDFKKVIVKQHKLKPIKSCRI